MITIHEHKEIERLHQAIQARKARISKLRRMEKLGKDADLISELDTISEQSEKAIFAILDSKELLDAGKEQVVLHRNAGVRLMAKGLRQSFCDSEKQVEVLNNEIEEANIRIKEIEGKKTTQGGNIV